VKKKKKVVVEKLEKKKKKEKLLRFVCWLVTHNIFSKKISPHLRKILQYATISTEGSIV
jgi:hypothetical protein